MSVSVETQLITKIGKVIEDVNKFTQRLTLLEEIGQFIKITQLKFRHNTSFRKQGHT